LAASLAEVGGGEYTSMRIVDLGVLELYRSFGVGPRGLLYKLVHPTRDLFSCQAPVVRENGEQVLGRDFTNKAKSVFVGNILYVIFAELHRIPRLSVEARGRR
jgi:hypothetical protein